MVVLPVVVCMCVMTTQSDVSHTALPHHNALPVACNTHQWQDTPVDGSDLGKIGIVLVVHKHLQPALCRLGGDHCIRDTGSKASATWCISLHTPWSLVSGWRRQRREHGCNRSYRSIAATHPSYQHLRRWCRKVGLHVGIPQAQQPWQAPCAVCLSVLAQQTRGDMWRAISVVVVRIVQPEVQRVRESVRLVWVYMCVCVAAGRTCSCARRR